MPGLRRNTGLKSRKHLIGGTLVSAGQVRRNGSCRTCDLGDLEDRDIRVGTRHVTASDVEERIEHRGAQPGGIICHGIA